MIEFPLLNLQPRDRGNARQIGRIESGEREALPYDAEAYKSLKEIGEWYRKADEYKKSSKEYKFWIRHNWIELRKEFLTERGENGSYLYPQLADFIEAKWQDPNERQYAKLIIGPRPKKKVP